MHVHRHLHDPNANQTQRVTLRVDHQAITYPGITSNQHSLLKVLHTPRAASQTTHDDLSPCCGLQAPQDATGSQHATEAGEHTSTHKGTTNRAYDTSNTDSRSASAGPAHAVPGTSCGLRDLEDDDAVPVRLRLRRPLRAGRALWLTENARRTEPCRGADSEYT